MEQTSTGFDAGQAGGDPIAEAYADRDYLKEILGDPRHPKHGAALKALPKILAEPKYASLGITEEDVRDWLQEDFAEECSDHNPNGS